MVEYYLRELGLILCCVLLPFGVKGWSFVWISAIEYALTAKRLTRGAWLLTIDPERRRMALEVDKAKNEYRDLIVSTMERDTRLSVAEKKLAFIRDQFLTGQLSPPHRSEVTASLLKISRLITCPYGNEEHTKGFCDSCSKTLDIPSPDTSI